MSGRWMRGSRGRVLLLVFLSLVAGIGCSRPKKQPSTAVPAAAPAGRFRNLAEPSGLAAFRHTDGGSGRRFFVEQMGSGVAVFDFDGDGLQDVYFCTGTALPGYTGPAPSNRLFRNRGDGTFEDRTDAAGVACRRYSIGAAAADFDNDGDVDLYVCCFGKNVLYRNDGDGSFTDVSEPAGVNDSRLSSSAAWGDYDGDGYLDLFVANYVKYRLEEDLWCSKYEGHKSYCGPTLYQPERSTLYHNNGNGTFTDVTITSGVAAKRGNGLGVVWFDFDEDGRQDVFVANDQTPNHLWWNRGHGKFQEVGLERGVAYGEEGNARAGMGVDAGDFDNDGRIDLVVTNFSEENNAIYRNEGASFRDVAFDRGVGAETLMQLGFGTAFLDFDRDGWLDLFFANGHVLDDISKYSDSVTWEQSLQLFRNSGTGHFREVTADTGVGEGEWVARGAALGDMDNDGRKDLVISVLRGKPLYLRNECAPASHWLGVDLRPATGNAQAIGATVWLTANGITQRRDVRTAGSFASSNDPRPLFGLGSAVEVEELKVEWPSGQVTLEKGPAIDRYLRIDEPAPANRQASRER